MGEVERGNVEAEERYKTTAGTELKRNDRLLDPVVYGRMGVGGGCPLELPGPMGADLAHVTPQRSPDFPEISRGYLTFPPLLHLAT